MGYYGREAGGTSRFALPGKVKRAEPSRGACGVVCQRQLIVGENSHNVDPVSGTPDTLEANPPHGRWPPFCKTLLWEYCIYDSRQFCFVTRFSSNAGPFAAARTSVPLRVSADCLATSCSMYFAQHPHYSTGASSPCVAPRLPRHATDKQARPQDPRRVMGRVGDAFAKRIRRTSMPWCRRSGRRV